MILPPTNFANAEHTTGALRLWVSVSTRKVPREQAMRSDVADGYIVLKDSARRPHRRRRPGLHQREQARSLRTMALRQRDHGAKAEPFRAQGRRARPARDRRGVRRGYFPGRLRVRRRGRHLDRERGQQPAAAHRTRRQPARGAGRWRSRDDRARRAAILPSTGSAAPTSMPAATAFSAISPASPSAAPTSGRSSWAPCFARSRLSRLFARRSPAQSRRTGTTERAGLPRGASAT